MQLRGNRKIELYADRPRRKCRIDPKKKVRPEDALDVRNRARVSLLHGRTLTESTRLLSRRNRTCLQRLPRFPDRSWRIWPALSGLLSAVSWCLRAIPEPYASLSFGTCVPIRAAQHSCGANFQRILGICRLFVVRPLGERRVRGR